MDLDTKKQVSYKLGRIKKSILTHTNEAIFMKDSNDTIVNHMEHLIDNVGKNNKALVNDLKEIKSVLEISNNSALIADSIPRLQFLIVELA